MTRCNYCSLVDMQADARARGVEVIVEVIESPDDEMRGWVSARYSDQAEPSAWFMSLPRRCVC